MTSHAIQQTDVAFLAQRYLEEPTLCADSSSALSAINVVYSRCQGAGVALFEGESIDQIDEILLHGNKELIVAANPQ
jgi:hypothetical protein